MVINCCCVVIDCGIPPSPANGVVTVSNAVFDSVANYSCKIGYHLSGDVSRRCGRDGEWSNRQPTCAGKYRARYWRDNVAYKKWKQMCIIRQKNTIAQSVHVCICVCMCV